MYVFLKDRVPTTKFAPKLSRVPSYSSSGHLSFDEDANTSSEDEKDNLIQIAN